MELYQLWWEEKRVGFCDLATWMMKVRGASDSDDERGTERRKTNNENNDNNERECREGKAIVS